MKPRRSVNIAVPSTSSPPSRSSPPVRASTWSTTASGTKRENVSCVRTRSNASSRYSATSTPIDESTSASSGYVRRTTRPWLNASCAATTKSAPTPSASAGERQPRSRRLATRRDQPEEHDQHEVPAAPEAPQREAVQRRLGDVRLDLGARHRPRSRSPTVRVDVLERRRRRRRSRRACRGTPTAAPSRRGRARTSRSGPSRAARRSRSTAVDVGGRGIVRPDATSAATMPKLFSFWVSYGTWRMTPSESCGDDARCPAARRTARARRRRRRSSLCPSFVHLGRRRARRCPAFAATAVDPGLSSQRFHRQRARSSVCSVNWMSTAIALRMRLARSGRSPFAW